MFVCVSVINGLKRDNRAGVVGRLLCGHIPNTFLQYCKLILDVSFPVYVNIKVFS